MSVDTELDTAFVILLAKAENAMAGLIGGGSGGGGATVAAVLPATVNFEWTGGGSPIVAVFCDPVVVEVPFACRIAWAHLRAGDATGSPVAVNAVVDLQLAQFETFGGRTPLYGTSGAPALNGSSKNNLGLSGWKIDLTTGDTLTARLSSFTGNATWLSLTLLLRPTDVPITVSNIVNSTGAPVVDSAGNQLVLKGPN